jgi:hypothetical protein
MLLNTAKLLHAMCMYVLLAAIAGRWSPVVCLFGWGQLSCLLSVCAAAFAFGTKHKAEQLAELAICEQCRAASAI